MLAKMKGVPFLADADTTLRSGKPEVRLVIDRNRAADLGVSVMDIEQALNTLVAGQVASTFKAGEDQYDVRVRAQEQFRGSADALARLTVPSSKLGSVELDEVAHIVPGTGPSSINRIGRQRQVTVTGNVLPGGSQAGILQQMNQFKDELNMDPDYRAGLTGGSKELGRTGYYFMLAFSLTFIFMYIVLAAQFESFIHPITILITLPLAIPFGIVSLLITGQTVNIFSGLGLLLLFGIVKKNAILQIDHTNGLREGGMQRYDAIIQANRDRLRPILMTTIALIAGMAPLVISRGTGAATNRSIGVLVVGGQALCLLLTLLAVPVFYSVFEDLGAVFVTGPVAGFFRGLRGRARKLVAIATALVSSAFGQTTTTVRPIQEVTVKQRVGVLGQTTITLKEVIERVLENDPDLRVARIAREEAGYGYTSAQGFYDPVIGMRAYHTKATVAVSSILGGSASGKLSQQEWNAAPQVSGITPTGGSYSLSFVNSRQTTANTFATLNPLYPTALNLNLTQPLWRGLRFDENRHRLEVSRQNQYLSEAQLRQRINDVVTMAINAYWELNYATQVLNVQTEAVRLAEQQFESNRRQAEQGVLAPIDVVAAQTQVATFQQALFAAQQAVTQSENTLKSLMLPDRNDLMWGMALIPTWSTGIGPDTEFAAVKIPSLNDAVTQALKLRPELAVNFVQIEVNKLDARLANDQTRPRIDAFANLSAAGLAGIPLSAGASPLSSFFPGGFGSVPGLLQGSYGQSLSTLFAGNFPTAQLGVQISLPLRNRTAQAQSAIASAEGRRLRVVQDQLETAVEMDVRNTLQAMSSAQDRLEAAALARRSAEEQYASEQRQFQAGTSTVFLVLQRQTDLIVARSREVRARADLGEAEANLDHAIGRTAEVQQIQVK